MPTRYGVATFPPATFTAATFTAATFTAAASLVCVAACSSEGGRAREEDTTTSGNRPGGSSYVPSTGGPAAAPDSEQPAAGAGPNLVVASSWVDASTNGVGIQGAFFTYQDPTGRTLIGEVPGGSGTGFCVSGTAAEVLAGNFSSTWGAVAALNLSQEAGATTAGSYDAAAHGVVGFGFDIVGDTAGALRFVVKQFSVHDGFCINNVPNCADGCSAEFAIDELTQNCWTPGGATPDATSLSALEWQIVAKEGSETPFDYCIENIHAVLSPAAE